MSDLKKDIALAQTTLDGMRNKIYTRSNEALNELFKRVNVKDKKVLTVLGSSDQLFATYLNGAEAIDTFDVNPLTYRYFYLRKWLMQFGYCDANGLTTDEVKNILKKILPMTKEEAESLLFWEIIISQIKHIYFYDSNLFYDVGKYDKDFQNLSKDQLNDLNYNFYNIDLGASQLNIPAPKYDKVFISNILDYCFNNDKLRKACANLNSICKQNSEIIACSFFKLEEDLECERKIFSPYFEYEHLFNEELKRPYYKYIKK